MSNEELVILIQQGVDVKKNLGRLYLQNQGFINRIIAPLCEYAEHDDLMQEAYFGIAKAVEHFDTSQDFTFLTYAGHKIRQACVRYVQNNSNLIRIPVHMQERIKAYKKLCKKYDDIVEPEIVMQELNLTKQQYDDMILTILGCECVSLESVVKGHKESERETTIADLIADPCVTEDDIIEQQMTEAFWNCLDILDDRSKEILLKRYKQEMTLKQIADELGVTGERIRQIEKKALFQLKVLNTVQEYAGMYDYDCGIAYHSGIRNFRETGISGTEKIVLKRIDLQKSYEKHQKKLKNNLEVLQSASFDNVTLNRINELCVQKGVRIKRMEQESGLSAGSFSKWKRGFTPSKKSLLKVSKYFGVSVAYLIGEADEKGHAEQDVSASQVVNRIMTLCNVKGVTIREMEKGSGLGSGSVSKWKKGFFPSQKSLKKVADYFGVPVAQLQGFTC